MLNEFKDWVQKVLGTTYTYSRGLWVETSTSSASRYCAIQATGGPAIDVDDRNPRFRVILLGRRNEREDAAGLLASADALIADTLSRAQVGNSLLCSAATVRAITEVTGPGYTSENRAWCQIDFQVTF